MGHIKTPLLRFFAYYYGYIGVALHPLSLRIPSSVLLFLWNCLLNSLCLYSITFFDPFEIQSTIQYNVNCNISKPLLHFFVHFSVTYIFPSLAILSIGYYIVYSRRLMRLLDAPPFRTVYSSRRQAVLIFALILTVNCGVFLNFLLHKLGSAVRAKSLVVNTLETLCLFCVSTYSYLLFFIVHYAQHGTLEVLNRFHQQLLELPPSGPAAEVTIEVIRRQLINLAVVNKQLNYLLGGFVLLFLIPHTTNLILTISISLICRQYIILVYKWLSSTLYLLYVASLNYRVLRRYTAVVGQLNVHRQRRAKGATRFYPILPLHYDCFSLQAFNMLPINVQLLLHVLIHTVNYVTLFSNTN